MNILSLDLHDHRASAPSMAWIDEASHVASKCSPWRASGAGPRDNYPLPKSSLLYWRTGNSNPPLAEGVKKVFKSRLAASRVMDFYFIIFISHIFKYL